MNTGDFRRSWEWLHRMTVDFAEAVPDDKWDLTPDRRRFGPYCKQLRHMVCGRGVYNAAMITKRADWSRARDYYTGSLSRHDLLLGLSEMQRQFLVTLETLDVEAPIDFGGTLFTFENFACEVVQHEAIHHGQWSVYAALGDFATPRSWRVAWKL